MTAPNGQESDADFVERMNRKTIGATFPIEKDRLIALARRGITAARLPDTGKDEELEKLRRINSQFCKDWNSMVIAGARDADRARAAEARADAQIAIVERIRDQYASTGGHGWTALDYALKALREVKS